MKRRMLSYAAIITIGLVLGAGWVLGVAEPSNAADQVIKLRIASPISMNKVDECRSPN